MTQTSGAASPEASERDSQTPGRLLRAARQRQGLSLQQVAEQLNLDASAVEAIEADRFLALGAPVYAKGHLRKYATCLGLAVGPVLASYDALNASSPATTVAPAASTHRGDVGPWAKPSVWVAVALLAGSVAVLWIWKFAEVPPDVAKASRDDAAERTIATPQAAAGTTTAADASVPMPVPVAAVAEPEPAVSESAARAAAAGTVAPEIQLTLVFEQPSWTEVYDAGGAKLMFDTGRVGQTRTLSGLAPLTVVLGSAIAVHASVDGKPIVIPRRANRDSTRFAVHAGGEVR